MSQNDPPDVLIIWKCVSWGKTFSKKKYFRPGRSAARVQATAGPQGGRHGRPVSQPPPFRRASPPCDMPSGCCFLTGPWTVTRSSLRTLRWVAVFCRQLQPVLLPVSCPRSRRPVVGVPGLCWMWRDVPFARQRRPGVGVLGVVLVVVGVAPPPPLARERGAAESAAGNVVMGCPWGLKLHRNFAGAPLGLAADATPPAFVRQQRQRYGSPPAHAHVARSHPYALRHDARVPQRAPQRQRAREREACRQPH